MHSEWNEVGCRCQRRSRARAMRRVCAALAAASALLASASCMPRPPMPRSPEIGAGVVVFRYRDPVAQVVQVAGSWETNFHLRGREWTSSTRVGVMLRGDDGIWELAAALGPGRYEYLFLVDGRFWELDPANPQRVADGQGGFVSLLVVP